MFLSFNVHSCKYATLPLTYLYLNITYISQEFSVTSNTLASPGLVEQPSINTTLVCKVSILSGIYLSFKFQSQRKYLYFHSGYKYTYYSPKQHNLNSNLTFPIMHHFSHNASVSVSMQSQQKRSIPNFLSAGMESIFCGSRNCELLKNKTKWLIAANLVRSFRTL